MFCMRVKLRNIGSVDLVNNYKIKKDRKISMAYLKSAHKNGLETFNYFFKKH